MTAESLGYVDLDEFCRAKLLKDAIHRAELDACSCVVRHAEVYFVPASVRVRERLALEQSAEVRPFGKRRA